MNIFSLFGACLVACCSSVGSNNLHLDHKRNAYNQLSSVVDASYVVNNENSWGYVEISRQISSSGLMAYLTSQRSPYLYYACFYGYSYTTNTSFYFENFSGYYDNSYTIGCYLMNELNQGTFDFTGSTWVGALDEYCFQQISANSVYAINYFDRTYMRGGNPTYYVGYPYEVFSVESDNLSTIYSSVYDTAYYGLNTYMSYPRYDFGSGNSTYNVHYGDYGQKIYTQVSDYSSFNSTNLASAYTNRCTSTNQVIEDWGNLGIIDTFADFSLRCKQSSSSIVLSSATSSTSAAFYNSVSTIKYVLKPLITSDQDYSAIYNDGYDTGFDDGYSAGNDVGYNEGYEAGNTAGYQTGHAVGYNEGINITDYQFTDLFGAIADTPVLMIRSLFNFDFFGVNLLAVVLSLFTALIVFYLLRKLL